MNTDGDGDIFELAEKLRYPIKYISEVIVDMPSPTSTRMVMHGADLQGPFDKEIF